MDWITEPFEHAFMRQSLLAVTLVGINCAIIGVYVVLRRIAFMGDAIAHTILPGIVFAYLKGFSMILGALAASVLTALCIGSLSQKKQIREDTAIGVVFTAMFALGVLMMSHARSFRDFHSILFGHVIGVSLLELTVIAIGSLVVYATLLIVHKELELSSVDPSYSRLIGAQPDRLRTVLLVLIAITVVAAIQAVGVLLTSALLITPAAAATLLSNRLPHIMAIASVIAVISGIAGLYISYYFAVSTGASIVLCCTAFFLLAWLIRSVRNRLTAS